MKWRARCLAALVLAPTVGEAQSVPPALRGGMLEASGFVHQVTNGFGDWHGARLRAVVPAGSRSVFFLEGVGQRAFRDDGFYATVAHQLAAGDDWITYLGIGAGSGEFVFPDLRVDATVTRKLLPSRRLLVSVGGTWVRSKDVYRDRTAVAALTGYLGATAVLEVGGRFNWSSPGEVASQRAYAALTLGRSGRRYLVLRGAGGSEAYQLTGSGATEHKFNSTEASLSWRECLGTGV
jgi:YaiO family outer membrane protein